MALAAEVYKQLFTLHPGLAKADLSDQQLTRIAQKAGIRTKEPEQQAVCPLCGENLKSKNTQYHHCVPVWAGGGDRNVGNLLSICGDCHKVADGLTKIGYVFNARKAGGIDPYLTEMSLLSHDKRIINGIRLYRAQTRIVPEVRRLVGPPHGTVFRRAWLFDSEVANIVTEWLPEIESAFGNAYQRRIPVGTSCRRNRLPPEKHAFWNR